MRQVNTALLKAHIDSLGRRGLEKLAITADLSPSTLANVVNGRQKNPAFETISKLVSATGHSFDELFPLKDQAA